MCHMSHVMYHLSLVTCHLSPVKCQQQKNDFFLLKIYIYFFFLSFKKLEKVVELVGGVSVINGAYPVYV